MPEPFKCGFQVWFKSPTPCSVRKHNHRFLLQMKHKTVDKALEEHFLKEFKASCKNSSESELKQQNEMRHSKEIRLVVH